MYLENKINRLMQLLSEDDYFDDIQLIRAYPYSIKETRLTSPIVTFSPSKFEAKSISMDNLSFSGEYGIAINLFSPYQKGNDFADGIMERIIKTLINEDVIGVSLSPTVVESKIFCLKTKCVLMFNCNCNLRDD